MTALAPLMKTGSQTLPPRLREARQGERIGNRQIFSHRLRDGETCRIRVLSGHLWVTFEGMREDHHLTAGKVLQVQGPGLLVAEGIEGGAVFAIT